MDRSLGYIIQRLQNTSLRGVSNDFFDHVDWVDSINRNLVFIYSYLNEKGSRYYSNFEEILTPVSERVYNLTYRFTRLHSVVYMDDNSNYVDYIQPRNVALGIMPNLRNVKSLRDFESEHIYARTGESQITTSQKYSKIYVAYTRYPKWHDYNNLDDNIDLPQELDSVLYYLCHWDNKPMLLEQGASLSNNYFQQAQAYLDLYMKAIGYSNVNQGMIA